MEEIEIIAETIAPISEESTREEVANFIYDELKLKEDIKKIFLNEYITGDVLPLLNKNDLMSLNIKLGPAKKIINYIENNKNNFKDKKINIKLNPYSKDNEVKEFFMKYLGFKESINLDGKKLFELDEEDMKRFGLKYGQRKRLINYIKYFEENENIYISKKSTVEEVAKLLRSRFNFSKECIDEICLDGESLLSLNDEEIDSIECASKEQKEKLKKFINEEKLKEKEMKIDSKSSIKKICEFLKKKLNFSDRTIEFFKEQEIDGEIFFQLNDEEIDDFEVVLNDEKEKIKIFLNEYKSRNKKNDIPKSEKENNKIEEKKEDLVNLKNKELKKDKNEINKNNKEEEINKFNESINKENEKQKKISDNLNDISNNFPDKKKKEIFGVESQKKIFFSFENMTVSKLQTSTYNTFFFIILTDYQSNSSSLSSYVENNYLFSSIFYNYRCNLISKAECENERNGKNIFYLFQISTETPLKKLKITIRNKNKKYNYESNSIIDINKEEIYFHLCNLKYDTYDNFINADINSILGKYLDYFYHINDNSSEKFQNNLVRAISNKISKENYIRISFKNFLMIIKLCIKFQIEINIENIEIRTRKSLDYSKYYITEKEIDRIISKKKFEIINYIVLSLVIVDPTYLFILIKGSSSQSVCRSILDLLIQGELNYDDVLRIFKKNPEFNFQKFLLSVVTKKKDLDFVVNLKKGLLNSLNFIRENFNFIIAFDSNCFPISLDKPCDNDDISQICTDISDIINISSNTKYKIINVEEIFENLLNFTSNKDLNEMCQLHSLIRLFSNTKKGQNLSNNFYQNIHEKGFNLIKNGKLNSSEIFKFIMSQDIYYFSPKYNNSEYRDPDIFKYISITKKSKNDIEYLKNINIIKNNRLFSLFSHCSKEIQKKFYKNLLEQIKGTIIDLKSIFDIFPKKYIDEELIILINEKVVELKFSIIEEIKENEQNLFEVLDQWILCNFEKNKDLKTCVDFLEEISGLTPGYYFHLFKSREMNFIYNTIKNFILNFFMNQYKEKKNISESLIFLLLNSQDQKICLNILEQMDSLMMSKDDFYQNEENLKYKLFKLFLENKEELYKNSNILKGKYYKEITELRDSIINDIKNKDIIYELINNSSANEEGFNKKIKFIFNSKKMEVDSTFFELKISFAFCQKKLNELEKLKDYLETFLSNTKKEEIDILNGKIKEIKKKKLSEIIKMNKFFSNDEFIDFEHLIKDSQKLKYKNSKIFMKIIRDKMNNECLEKTEEEILNESFEQYINLSKELIFRKDLKKEFLDNNNLKDILVEIVNNNNDLNKEIKLILEEL